MISLKLDSDQLERLDSLCRELGCNRNKLINFSVKMLNDNLSSHRECSLVYAYQIGLSGLL